MSTEHIWANIQDKIITYDFVNETTGWIKNKLWNHLKFFWFPFGKKFMNRAKNKDFDSFT